MRTDSEIKKDAEDELRWDPDIDATDVAVAVHNGVSRSPALYAVICKRRRPNVT
jgi:hypothetical protein